MKVFDSVNKTEVEVDGTKGLIQLMKDGRQVDLHLKEKKSDESERVGQEAKFFCFLKGVIIRKNLFLEKIKQRGGE